jgi:hypothetical protein
MRSILTKYNMMQATYKMNHKNSVKSESGISISSKSKRTISDIVAVPNVEGNGSID